MRWQLFVFLALASIKPQLDASEHKGKDGTNATNPRRHIAPMDKLNPAHGSMPARRSWATVFSAVIAMSSSVIP